jgi:uncharacterized coiled-coil DUF342 family protein
MIKAEELYISLREELQKEISYVAQQRDDALMEVDRLREEMREQKNAYDRLMQRHQATLEWNIYLLRKEEETPKP